MLKGKNLPILFAILLAVGALEEYVIVSLGNLGLVSWQEALIIMASIALGFGIAVQKIHPFMEKVMVKFRSNFKKRSGILGAFVFYLLMYALLFILYDAMITIGYFK